MYLEHYNLKVEPFGVTPDPDFLYLSPTHKEALATVIYGIRERKGFISVTGEVGTGKTTILRSALQRLDSDTEKAIYIFNSNLTFKEVLRTIFYELGIETVPRSTLERIRLLQEILIDEYNNGKNIFLVIDEAQNMPMKTLENLRMLSNLETTKDKLLQIVLVGQPELDRKLSRYELRQLRQRIAVRAVLKPLTDQESLDYIRHRLMRAEAPRVWLFTEGAKELILKHAHGNPRLINVICDNALIAGFGYQKKIIATSIVEEVIEDLLHTHAIESEPLPREHRSIDTEQAPLDDAHVALRNSAGDPVQSEALNLLIGLLNASRQNDQGAPKQDSAEVEGKVIPLNKGSITNEAAPRPREQD